MKLLSIFKKEKTTKVKTNAHALDKKQLAKVIGGAETVIISPEKRGIEKSQIE